MEEILAEINKREIKYLFHFTRIEYLASIIKNGILSRTRLEDDGETEIFNDQWRYDGMKKASCFTLEHPNKYLLDRFKEEFDTTWVILKLDIISLLKEHQEKIYFAYHNAAESIICQNISKMFTLEDFKYIFNERITKSNGKSFCRDFNLQECYPTSTQAEILIEGVINFSHVLNVYFDSASDCDKFKNNPIYVNLKHKFIYKPNCIYFKHRPNIRQET